MTFFRRGDLQGHGAPQLEVESVGFAEMPIELNIQ
jgi:hypothetical protein